MVIFKEDFVAQLMDYGIEIPLLRERGSNTYQALREKYGSSHGDWFYGGDFISVEKADLLRAHTQWYVDLILSESPESALSTTYELEDGQGEPYRFDASTAAKPLKELVKPNLNSIKGTSKAIDLALEKGFCYFLGGGFHHAMSFGGRGFCLVNDIVIALRRAQDKHQIHTAWVIDVDAHKGDGTAELTHGDDSIRTLSVHMAESWPLVGPESTPKGELLPWWIPSDLDVPIKEGEEDSYCSKLQESLEEFSHFAEKPDIAIVVHGSDPWECDVLPSAMPLQLSTKQMSQRDEIVYNFLAEKKIPQAYVTAGGYGPENWRVHTSFLERVFVAGRGNKI